MYEYIIHCILIIFWAFFYPLFSQLIQGNCWEIHLLNNGGHSTSGDTDVLPLKAGGVLRGSPELLRTIPRVLPKTLEKNSE